MEFSPLVSAACALAFLILRMPAFHGWQNWFEMFWRGFWTTFIGFTLISLAANGNVYGGLLSVPFAAIYMLIYSGGYKWLPQTVLSFDRHVWIEHLSGWVFGALILAVIHG